MSIYEFRPEDAYDFAHFIGAKTYSSGGELVFQKCPFCGGQSEKRSNEKKFAINLKTGQYNCFRASCGAKGNMITLSRAFNFELPGYADEYYNSRKQYMNLSKAKRPTATEPAISYLGSRGIPEEIVRKYEITTDAKNPDLLVFPFFDENNTLQLVKYRNLKANKENGLAKEFVMKDQKTGLSCKPILFGMNNCDAKENGQLIMTEGQIDSLSVAAAGFQNAVSVPLGCNGFTWIPYCWNFLQSFKELIVFGDFEKGRITLLDDMKKYFNGTLLHVRPEDYKDCKDANEILKKYGKEQIRRCIEKAEPVGSDNIVRLSDIRPRPISEMQPIETGIRSLDRILGGFYFGQLVILTGERGEGKSTLSNQLALFAVNAGVKTFIYSGELPNGSLRDWIDHQAAGSRNMIEKTDRFGDVYCELDQQTSETISQWYSDYLWIYQNQFLEDVNAEEEQTVVELIGKAARDGFRFIIIDNLMTALEDDARIDIYRAQTKFVKQLVRIAKARDVLIVLVAHQRKNQGTNRTADDVSGSANITNLADIVMTFGKVKDQKEENQSEEQDTTREIRIQKNRLTGKLGKPFKVWFEPTSRRISDKEGDFDFKLNWETAETEEHFMDAEDVPNPFEEVIVE